MKRKQLMVTLLWSVMLSTSFGQTVETVNTAVLSEPYGVAVDVESNTYYITDGSSNSLLAYDPKTGETRFASDFELNSPEGVVVTARAGLGKGLVVVEAGAHRILFVSPEGLITTLAGGTRGFLDSNTGPQARFNSPAGIAVDAAGNLYVADLNNNAIRVIDNTAAAKVTTISGGFFRPAAVAVGENGLVYVADTGNHVIKTIDTRNGNAVATIAGQAGISGGDFGAGSFSLFDGPRGLLWVGGDTGLLVSDTGNHAIRRVFRRNNFWLTDYLAGAFSSPGNANGSLTSSRFNEPVGLAIDANGAILVADLKNNALRRVLRPAVAIPIFNFAGGSFSNTVSLVVTNATTNSTLRYTLDGNDPTSISPLLSKPFDITSGPAGLKVRGFSPDLAASQTVSNNFTFFVNPLTITEGGTFSNDVAVAISSLTDGTTVRFVGSGLPSTNSPVWSDRIISKSGSIVAQGFRDGFTPSPVVSNKFNFVVAPLVINRLGGTFVNDAIIKIETITKDAEIRFTTDGQTPDESSPIWTARSNNVNGILLVKAFKDGYETTPLLSNTFNFFAAQPVIVPAGATNNNEIEIGILSETIGSSIRYKVGSGAATETTNGAVFILSKSGTLTATAIRNGYLNSTNTTATFVLKTADPVIKAPITTSNNPVVVSFRSITTNATFVYTTDGSVPSGSNGVKISTTNDFQHVTNGLMRVVALRDGFENSEVIDLRFNLKTSTPKIELTPVPKNGVNINTVQVKLSSDTENAVIKYTVDGSTTNLITYSTPFAVTTNTTVWTMATRSGFADSDSISQDIGIQVDTPVMNPPGGFFQDGTKVSLTVARANASIYYTTDGSVPTTNSLPYTGTPITVNQLTLTDLRQLRARAFAADTIPSDVVSGQLSTNNTIGVARDVIGSMGSTIVVPVIVSLKSNDVLRTMQYRLQVWPSTVGAPALPAESLRILSVGTNDFIPVTGSDPSGNTATFTIQSVRTGNTNELIVSAIGIQSKLFAKEFATLNLVAITLPGGAAKDQTYGIRILEPSGTADGQQQRVFLDAGPDRSIRISPTSYVVGDSSTAGWYNAGDFGDGNLDNSDVNNAFYASLGLRMPYRFTDVFDAMDAYPVDENDAVSGVGFAGGDGQIRFLDWQIILQRSLRRDTNNWARNWTNNGTGVAFRVPVSSGLTVVRSSEARLNRQSTSSGSPTPDWSKQAMIEAENISQAQPGSTVRVPIYLNVRSGESVDGLQFLAQVKASGAALTEAPKFIPAPETPNARVVTTLPEPNQVSASWDISNGLNLRDRQPLGSVEFTIPSGAQAGDTYTVQFANADGGQARADGSFAQKDIESLSGAAGVRTTITNFFGRLSDDWRQYFFGALANPLSRPDADADGDGVTNWQEYVRGTNPAKLRLQLTQQTRDELKAGLKMRWLALPGKHYTLESTTDLSSGVWTPVQSGIIGDGSLKEFIGSGAADKTLFYRVRLEQ